MDHWLRGINSMQRVSLFQRFLKDSNDGFNSMVCKWRSDVFTCSRIVRSNSAARRFLKDSSDGFNSTWVRDNFSQSHRSTRRLHLNTFQRSYKPLRLLDFLLPLWNFVGNLSPSMTVRPERTKFGSRKLFPRRFISELRYSCD